MATHPSILVWRIPWTLDPGGLPTVYGSQRVKHNWGTKHEGCKIVLSWKQSKRGEEITIDFIGVLTENAVTHGVLEVLYFQVLSSSSCWMSESTLICEGLSVCSQCFYEHLTCVHSKPLAVPIADSSITLPCQSDSLSLIALFLCFSP